MKRMVEALHDINNCLVYTSVPVGLCGMCLSCRHVNSVGSAWKGPRECF